MEDNSKSLEELKNEAAAFLLKTTDIYEEVTFATILQRVGISFSELKRLVEDLIMDGKLKAKIQGNKILFHHNNYVSSHSNELSNLNVMLKQILDKLDDVKSDTELIKEYTSFIEQIMDKQESLEDFMIKRLGSDFDVIKHAWSDYKAGKIGKAGLIGQGIKLLGKKFIKKLLLPAV